MDLTPGLRRVPAADLADVGEDEALAARIRAEIEATGPMTFARFMELALHDPDGGYYRSEEARPGHAGDFLTAPEAHPIFGHAVANQLTEIWGRLDRPDPFVVHEHGAGGGALAEAVLRGLERTRSGLIDAIRYVLRGGIAWRALPHEYPPWQTVYHYFRAWRLDGTWERLNDELRQLVRERGGRNAQPSAAILDSQSAKTTEKGGRAATTGPRN